MGMEAGHDALLAAAAQRSMAEAEAIYRLLAGRRRGAHRDETLARVGSTIRDFAGRAGAIEGEIVRAGPPLLPARCEGEG